MIPRFILQALENSNITVHGDGMQTRSFLYIDDWIDATMKFLNHPSPDKEVLNIGSGAEITVLDLANLIIRITSSSSSVIFLPSREDDPRRRSADLTITKRVIAWEPKIDLEHGLEKTIEWFRSNGR